MMFTGWGGQGVGSCTGGGGGEGGHVPPHGSLEGTKDSATQDQG